MEENNTTTTTSPNTGGNNSMSLIVGAIVLAGLLGYVIFSSKDTGKNQDVAIETVPAVEESSENTGENENIIVDENQVMPETTDIEATNQEVKTFMIEAGSFSYNPNAIIVQKGDTVRIELTALDLMHDFNIDELGVKIPITQSGQTNTVEFVVNEAGSYEFYCSVGQHRQQGQVGTLIVQE